MQIQTLLKMRGINIKLFTMKNISKIVLLFSVLTLIIWSCAEDDRVKPTLQLQQEPVLSLLNNVDVEITAENQSQEAVPLSWTPANYSVPVTIDYTVQMERVGNDFANPVIVGTTSDTQMSVSGDVINQAMFDWGIFPGLEAPIEFRVTSMVSDDSEEGFSNTIQINATGFNPNTPTGASMILATQVPDHTWNWMAEQTICSLEDNGVYTGFVNFAEGDQLYFVPSGADEFVYYGQGDIDGLIEADGEAITVSEAGYYYISVNTNTNAYELSPAQFGIIGSSTPGGWSSDTDLTYDASLGMWSITTTMIPGEFKFRANDAWDLNYGLGPNDGTLAQNGPNIAFSEAEGMYTINMNLSGCCFTFEIVDAAGNVVVEPGSCEESEEPAQTYTFLYLVGDATAQGWDNNSIYSIFNDPDNENVYHYTGYFVTGGFKLLEVPGSWDLQYGLGDGPGLLSTDGGSGNIPVDADGYYTFTMNTAELTYSLEPYDASTAPTYNTLGLIGSSSPQGNWDADVDMTQSTFDQHIWYMLDATLTADADIPSDPGMKIRAEDAWDVNWGSDTFPLGIATPGGSNIAVTETGTYAVWFNDLSGRYVAIKQ